MSFVGRLLLNHIRHVQKAPVLSAAVCLQRLPAVAMTPTRLASKAATAVNEGMSAQASFGATLSLVTIVANSAMC